MAKHFFTRISVGVLVIFLAIGLASCNEVYRHPVALMPVQDSVLRPGLLFDSALLHQDNPNSVFSKIYTRNTNPQDLLGYARTLMNTPYVWGGTDPQTGFDCSGFITYVFNHFGISVPRTSIGYTNLQTPVPLETAKPGDIILFTGTDSGATAVGHMGIIESKLSDTYSFIHASSGKAMGVTISPLDAYYKSRFVKIIRVFPDSIYGSVAQ